MQARWILSVAAVVVALAPAIVSAGENTTLLDVYNQQLRTGGNNCFNGAGGAVPGSPLNGAGGFTGCNGIPGNTGGASAAVGGGGTRLTGALDAPRARLDELEGRTGLSGASSMRVGPIGIFANYNTQRIERERNNFNPGFNGGSDGISFGADVMLAERYFLGVAFGYEYSSGRQKYSTGSFDGRVLSASAFASASVVKGLTISTSVGYSSGTSGYRRPVSWDETGTGAGVVINGDVQGETKHETLSATLRGTYDVTIGRAIFGPSVALDGAFTRIGAYDETPAGARTGLELGYLKRSTQSVVVSPGVHGRYIINAAPGITVVPRVGMSYAFDLAAARRDRATVFMLDDPSRQHFVVGVDNRDASWMNLEAGIGASFGSAFSANLGYRTKLMYTGLEQHDVSIGGRVQF